MKTSRPEYHSSKVEFVCSFFGGIEDTIICFRDYLTFTSAESRNYFYSFIDGNGNLLLRFSDLC